MYILINLINHQPYEQICVDALLQSTVFSPCNATPYPSFPNHSHKSFHWFLGKLSRNETWDCVWSKCFFILEGEWCDELSICNPWLFLFKNPHVACPSQRRAEIPKFQSSLIFEFSSLSEWGNKKDDDTAANMYSFQYFKRGLKNAFGHIFGNSV